MRICLVSFEFPPYGGGEANYTYNLVKGLSRLGHSVSLVVPRRDWSDMPPVPASTTIHYVGTRGIPLLEVAGFLWRAKKILPGITKKEGIDLTHFTFDYPTFPFDFRGLGSPTVATVHHLHFVEAVNLLRIRPRTIATRYFAKQFLLTKSEQRFVSRMDGLIAASEFTRRSLPSREASKSRTAVIWHGIDAGAFLEADGERFRRRFDLLGEPFVLFVGRLEPSKGLDYLIPAFEKVAARFPEVRLVLIGRGNASYTRALQGLASSSRQRVIFAGYVDDETIRSAYAGASVVVLPSVMEGMGIVLLEAMAASKPFLATRVGGVPEFAEDGRTGLLVEPGSSSALAEGLLQLLGDPSRSKTMGENGRRLVQERFTTEDMTRQTVLAYARVLEGPRPLGKR